MTVAGKEGRAQGWGETPLSVQWTWPSSIAYQERCDAMQEFCRQLAQAWAYFRTKGHPIEVGHDFWRSMLPDLLKAFNRKQRAGKEPMPYLAALVCCSPFDIALHDAYGKLLGVPVYDTYNAKYMNVDLSYFLEPVAGSKVSFAGKYPADFFRLPPAQRMPAWHLVGGKDLLDASELTGEEPERRLSRSSAGLDRAGRATVPQGQACAEPTPRGTTTGWSRSAKSPLKRDVLWLTADFNCTVTDPAYVNDDPRPALCRTIRASTR